MTTLIGAAFGRVGLAGQAGQAGRIFGNLPRVGEPDGIRQPTEAAWPSDPPDLPDPRDPPDLPGLPDPPDPPDPPGPRARSQERLPMHQFGIQDRGAGGTAD